MNLKEYLKKSDMVYQTTIDPKGPGVVRIHLVPPHKIKDGIPWIVVINGFRILPILTTYAILLKEFILTYNEYNYNYYEEEQLDEILDVIVKNVKALYRDAKESDILEDLKEMLTTLIEVGTKPNVEFEHVGNFSLSEYYKHMHAPLRMDLMISTMEKDGVYNCNQKCVHCYAFNEKLSNEEELDTDSWFKIIDKLKEERVPQITFTGGEPTLRSDLVELIDHSKWFITRLNTNGILLTKELCHSLYNAELDNVQITFYSSDMEIHNKLVGGNHYLETLGGIKNAIAEKLDVSINTPLCSLNKNYKETIEFLSKLGVKYFTCSGLIPTGNTNSDESKELVIDKEELLKSLDEALAFARENELDIQFTSPGILDEKDLAERGLIIPSCGAGVSNMAILPNGVVIPCQSWLKGNALGNILEVKWDNIWNSKECKNIRKAANAKSNNCLLRGGYYEENNL